MADPVTHPTKHRRRPLQAVVMAIFFAALARSAVAAVPITTLSLGDVLAEIERDAPANVVAANAPELAAEIAARVVRVAVRVGDRVIAGDPLVELDCRAYASQLAAARAALHELEARATFAANQLRRALDLGSTRSISEELVDQRRSERDSLLAQQQAQRERVVQAELDVERCVVRAPSTAVVTERHADVGDLAAPGTVLLALVALDDPEVSAALREDAVDSLAGAGSIHFRYDGRDYPVRVRTVLPVVRERLLTREVRLSLPGTSPPIGAAGRLVWQPEGRRLPADYLVRRDGQLGVFVVRDGRARFVALPDASEGRPAAVALPPVTRIVVEGRQRLVDGEAVVERPPAP
jgi:RND family efflux transporter MFP subunit